MNFQVCCKLRSLQMAFANQNIINKMRNPSQKEESKKITYWKDNKRTEGITVYFQFFLKIIINETSK